MVVSSFAAPLLLYPFGFVLPAPSVHRAIATRGQWIRLGEGNSWDRPKWQRPGSATNPNQEAMRRLARLDQPRPFNPLEDTLAPAPASGPLESRRWWRRLEKWASPLGSGDLGMSASAPAWPLARASSETSAQDAMRLAARTDWTRLDPTSTSRAEALWEAACNGMNDELFSLRATILRSASAVGPREVAALLPELPSGSEAERPGRRVSRRLQRRWQRQRLVMDWVYGRGWHDGESVAELLDAVELSTGDALDATAGVGLRGLREASSAPLTGSHPYGRALTLTLTLTLTGPLDPDPQPSSSPSRPKPAPHPNQAGTALQPRPPRSGLSLPWCPGLAPPPRDAPRDGRRVSWQLRRRWQRQWLVWRWMSQEGWLLGRLVAGRLKRGGSVRPQVTRTHIYAASDHPPTSTLHPPPLHSPLPPPSPLALSRRPSHLVPLVYPPPPNARLPSPGVVVCGGVRVRRVAVRNGGARRRRRRRRGGLGGGGRCGGG